MIFAILFGAFLSTSIHSTVVQPDCIKREFKPDACKVSEVYYKLGQ